MLIIKYFYDIKYIEFIKESKMANTDYIGKIIGVKIDRELGSKHPKQILIYSKYN